MHVHAGGGGKTLIEFAPDVAFLARKHGRQQLVAPPLQPRRPEISSVTSASASSIGTRANPTRANALPVAHGLRERLAEAKGDVLGGVMRIDMRIALTRQGQIEPGPERRQGEHVSSSQTRWRRTFCRCLQDARSDRCRFPP